MVKKIGIGALIVVVLAGAYWAFTQGEGMLFALDEAVLQQWVTQLGPFGPLAIILVLAAAIVWSPIPSAPIGLVAGAAFGPLWGTVYTIIGAELGSFVAFKLARVLGRERLKRWLKGCLSWGWPQSQKSLMFFVFVSRLLPFVSFDMISYAAGFTALETWRFVVATLLGIAPVSFALAYFGGEVVSGDVQEVVKTVMLLMTLTSIPVLGKMILGRRGNEKCDPDEILVEPSRA
jgi:uncharacterized membrane protein YdjX (TVP38/TMEM64 family)